MLYLRGVILRNRYRAVQCQHHSDVSVKEWPAIFRRHDECFGRRLPFGALLFGSGQRCDVAARIAQKSPARGDRTGGLDRQTRGNTRDLLLAAR